MDSNIKEFENLSVEKKTLSTALGFEPRSFDCRSTALTTDPVAYQIGYVADRCPRRQFKLLYRNNATIPKYFRVFLNASSCYKVFQDSLCTSKQFNYFIILLKTL